MYRGDPERAFTLTFLEMLTQKPKLTEEALKRFSKSEMEEALRYAEEVVETLRRWVSSSQGFPE